MKFFLFLALYLVYPFSFLFPRNKKKWAFGSFRGAFNDNAKYLFIHCSNNCHEVDCVWLSKSRATVQLVRSKGLKSYFIGSPKGMWYALTSKYWFFNSYTSDIMFAFSGGAVCINLWHGVGLKRTEFNIISGKLAERFQEHRFNEVYFHPESFRRPNWLLSSTPFQSKMFASAFRIPESRCLEYGYPRNVILTCPEEERMDFVRKYEPASTMSLIERISGGHYSKVFVYMPTWRDSQREVFTQSFDLPRLDAMLKSVNSLLLLKPHANVLINPAEFAELKNIKLVDGKVDIYPVLPYTDVLITDYSSVLYDYILMPGKDVILYLYDYADYVKNRDLYYPFDENVVGRKVYNFGELFETIQKGNYMMDAVQRQVIVDRFWGETLTHNPNELIVEKVRSGELSGWYKKK